MRTRLDRHIRTRIGGRIFALALLVILSGVWVNCNRRGGREAPEKEGKVIARVNQTVLVEEELNEAMQGYFGDAPPDGGKGEYIEQWIESELLYQKAIQEGLQSDEEIRKKVSQFQHMLMEQEILRRHLDGRVEVSDEEVNGYYAENKELFARREDEYRLGKLIFPDEDIAVEVAGDLQAAPTRYDELITSEVYEGKITVTDLGYYPMSELEATFGDLIEELKVGEISQPVSVYPGNPYIIRVMEHQERGSVRELGEVADQIRGILIQEKRDRARELWIEELRREADVEVAADVTD